MKSISTQGAISISVDIYIESVGSVEYQTVDKHYIY